MTTNAATLGSDDTKLASDMFMAHVRDAQTEALKQPVPSLQEAKTPPEPDETSQLKLPLYSFTVDYTDPRGKRWHGRFANKILTIAEQINVGTVRARMQVGMAPESFSIETFEMLYMLTWLSTSLTEKPEWAKDLGSLLDVEIMRAVYEHVQRHEETFHGRSKPENTSKA